MQFVRAVIAGALCALTMSSIVAAQAGPSATLTIPALTNPAPASSAVRPNGDAPKASVLTPNDATAWLDGFMPYAIKKAGIPGAVVVVVKDGQIIAERGYGFADLEKGVKADPERSLFRPGSVSKLITWTALMQQVQAGKVDLDADVNRYIDFKIPPYHGKAVTITDLLTHTAGFEEQVKDILTNRRANLVPFDALLKRWVPERIFAPGTTPAYSNYGASLAGYIVQRVSGEPFESYVERHIFGPLGMTRSTFRQPLPAHLAPFAAEGYIYGKSKPYGFEYLNTMPAGAMSTTAADMAKFMIAHLQGGGAILSPATAQQMHTPLRQRIPGLPGMAYGFYDQDINNLRVVGHAGDTVTFHSSLNLFLDQGVGLFVALNSGGKEGASGGLRKSLFENFADRYFPAPADSRRLSTAQAKANAQKVIGSWWPARASYSNFLSIGGLFGQINVSADPKGRLIIPMFKDDFGQPRKWIAVAPMLWRDATGHDMAGARLENGKAALFGVGPGAAAVAFVRVPGHLSSSWLLPLLWLSLATLVLTALLWPARAAVRRHFGARLPLETSPLHAYRASRTAACAVLAVIVGWAVLLSMITGDAANAGAPSDPLLHFLQISSAVVFTGAAGTMAWYAWTTWRGGARWTAKLWSTLLVIASAVILYIGIVFHLVGWTSNY